MSHVTSAKARIADTPADLAALEAACEAKGLVFCRGQTTFKWYGTYVGDFGAPEAADQRGVKPEDYGRCDHAIRLPWTSAEERLYAAQPDQRPYEIGLARSEDGYRLLMDTYEHGKGVKQLTRIVGGGDCGLLLQELNYQKAVAQVNRTRSHQIRSVETLPNGTRRLVIGVREPDRV